MTWQPRLGTGAAFSPSIKIALYACAMLIDANCAARTLLDPLKLVRLVLALRSERKQNVSITYLYSNQMHIIYLTHIFITNYLLHVSVFVTPSSGRPLRYLLKNYMLFAMLLYNVQYTLS
jgi:hypothetical protein